MTAGRDRFSIVLFFVIAALLIAADLVLKEWSFQHVAGVPINPSPANVRDSDLIPPHDAVTLIPNVLSLKLTLNFGAVFGLGAGGRVFFIAVTFVAVAIIIAMFWKSGRHQRILHIALAMVLSGALGNLYDRVFIGAVRDMLYLFPGVKLPFGLNWPGGSDEVYPWIFNIADAALVIGVCLILLTLLRSPRPGRTAESS